MSNNIRGPFVFDNGYGTPASPGGYLGYGQTNLQGPGSSGPRIYAGSGDPNGVLVAPAGSLWLRGDGPGLGALYRNVDGLSAWVVASGGAGNTAPGSVFVLRPGGVSNGVNVFTDWTSLYAAVAPGGVPLPYPVTIYFDNTIVSPVPVGPAGNYPLPYGTALSGIDLSIEAFVELADGVSFNPGDGTCGGIFLDLSITMVSLSSAPIITVTAADDQQFPLFRGSAIRADGTAPWISFQNSVANGQLVILFEGGVLFQGVSPAVEIAGAVGNQLAIAVGFFGVVETDVILGAVGYNAAIVPAATSAVYSTVQPNFAGVLTIALFANAANLGYAAANVADWSGVNPANTADALDRIAAVLTPIP